MEVTPIER